MPKNNQNEELKKQKNIKKKKAFTLVELIVVITILAILGTIAFISFQGYSTNARNGVRLADLNNISKSLELFYSAKGFFPSPDYTVDMTYSGSLAWNQGTFGDTNMKNVDKLDHKPVDPLTLNEYTYSITNLKNEYQLGAVYEGGSLSYNSTPQRTETTQQSQTTSLPLIEKANAVGVIKANAMVIGNYNGKIIKINTGTTIYILAVPSIINGDILSTDIITMMTNKTLVYNNYSNLPDSYKNKGYSMTGGFDFIPQANILVYSGTVESLKDETNRTIFIDNLKKVYNNTVISLDPDFKQLIESDIVSNKLEAVKLANNIIENYVGKGIVPKTTTSTSQTTITESTDLWSLSDSDLKQIFSQTNSYYTSSWSGALNNCDSNIMQIVNVSDLNFFNSPKTLSGSTIYKVPNGTYNLLTTFNFNNIQLSNCSAIIGQSVEGVKLNLVNLTNVSLGLFYGTSNIIIHNMDINLARKNNSTAAGIYSGYNSTFSNLKIHSSRIDGAAIKVSAGNNLFKNIEVYDNDSWGINIVGGNNNMLKNIKIYNSGLSSTTWSGLNVWSSNENVFNNIMIFNNNYNDTDDGSFHIYSSSRNAINNVQSFNNRMSGLKIEYNGDNFINNMYSYNNGIGLSLEGNGVSMNDTFHKFYLYNNAIRVNYFNFAAEINRFYGMYKYFGNGADSIFGTLNFIGGIDGFLGMPNGLIDVTGTMSCAWHSQPNLVVSWGATCSDKLRKTSGITMPVTSYTYGSNIGNQERPVRWNSSISNWEFYGTDGVDYDSSKKVGEW